MNVKYLFEMILIFLGVFYYYVATLFREQTSSLLPIIVIAGILLSGVLMIRYMVINNITRSFIKYLGVFFTIFTISYILQWPNILWIAIMSVPLLTMGRDGYIKFIFYLSSIMFTTVVVLSFIGILPLEYIGFGGGVEERYGIVKYSLGFDGPNQAAFSFFAILLSGLYSYGRNRAFVAIMSILTLIIGVATGSRTGMICSLLFIACFLFIQRKKQTKKSKILPHLFVICFIVSLFTVTMFSKDQNMNELLSSRPALISQYTQSDYIPKVFGSNEVYNKAKYQTAPLDNFTIYVLAKYGVVGFTAMALLFYIGLRKELSPKLKCLFIFVMLYGMFEAFFDMPGKDFLLPIFLYSAATMNDKTEILV